MEKLSEVREAGDSVTGRRIPKVCTLIQTGLYYRLSDPAREEYAAWAFVSEDQEEVLLNVVLQEIHGNMNCELCKASRIEM